MNIYEKRHAILARHLGERFTPAQLKVELLEKFPGVKPQSVNASDCYYSDRKRAGSTCPECRKLGGFAVNKDGFVDLGAGGWGNISPIYIPTGNHHVIRRATIPTPQPSAIFRFSADDGVKCVRLYNTSFYKGRKNTELDREAYRIFSGGLSPDVNCLVDQIAFVGEHYGAAQERFGSIRKEAALIAANLHLNLNPLMKVVMEARPLIDKLPDQADLDFLFSLFKGTTKQWPVWASKTLHFLRPSVFPILDSNAKKPLGLRNLSNTSKNYCYFCSIIRNVLLTNAEALAAASIADNSESPTNLKLLDKILFQLGLQMV